MGLPGAWLLGTVVTLGLFSGCALDYASEGRTTVPVNECSSDSECGNGFCGRGICQTSATSLGALLLGVTPPASTPTIAGVTFLQRIEEFELGPDGVALEVAGVSRIRGRILDAEGSAQCVPATGVEEYPSAPDGSLPARLTVIPRARLLGIPNPSSTTQALELDGESYTLELAVPPGRYDIYVEPEGARDGCIRPPYLALDQEFPSGEVDFRVTLPESEALGMSVIYPGDSNDLEDWSVSIVESKSGRLLSNRALLSDSRFVDGGWEYTASLAFTEPVDSTTRSASELVRLAPPDGVTAPAIYVERSVVDLFRDGQGLLDQLTTLPDPVLYQARVATDDARKAARASLRLVATSLDATAPGTIAEFSRTVETDEDGLFEVELLPGEYRVIAEPWDERLAPREIEIKLSDAAVQAGQTIEVEPRTVVSGRLRGFSGESLAGVAVGAQAVAANDQLGVLARAQGRARLTPLAIQTTTLDDGSFSYYSDVGQFAFFARPQATSQFAWRVLLGVDVAEESSDLGNVSLTLPVSVDGKVTSSDVGALGQALIVAYAYLLDGELTEDSAAADSVIPVAEARSNDDGSFRLLLPSSFK